MIRIYFDQASIDANAKYVIEKYNGFPVGVRKGGEHVDGRRFVDGDPQGAKVNLEIIDGDRVIGMFYSLEDGSHFYAYTGKNLQKEFARLRHIELLAIAAATGDGHHLALLQAALNLQGTTEEEN